MVEMFDLHTFSRDVAVSQFLGRNWPIQPSFITLAFQNGLEDRNADVKRLNGDDPLHVLLIEIWCASFQ